MLNRLAEHYPTPRAKQEVPVWLYLASELTLKLHGAESYHAFPRVPRSLRSLRLFDEEGLFIGDGSYLFVPNNEHYEGSDLPWFDEHNHPVDPKKVDLRDFHWAPYVPAAPPEPAPLPTPKPPRVQKREAKRQQTLARRKAEAQAETRGLAARRIGPRPCWAEGAAC